MQGDYRPVHQQSGNIPVAEPPKNTHQFSPQSHTPPPKKGWRSKYFGWFNRLSKKQKIIFFSALAGLLVASGLIWWFVIRKPAPAPKKEAPKKVKKEEKPTTVPSRLTGVQISPELNKLPTTGIMIENSPSARPQSGLFDAGVVYEAIAEGGITRYLAIYMETSPDYIGPVRSLRPYYLDFVAPYDAGIVHAGGSAQALAEVKNYRNLEAFQNPNYFQRISSRAAPHNLYTNRQKLLELQQSKGWGESNFTGFERKGKAGSPAELPAANAIDLSISSALYNVHYDYNADHNVYLRNLGGAPHIDEKTNAQIAPSVVVALVMSHHYEGQYSVYGDTGTGQMFVFQDGKVIPGTWQKTNRDSQFKFTDEGGAPLKLNPGQTWVTIVSSPGAVTYQ